MFGTSVDLTQEQNTRDAQVSFKTIATEMEQFVTMAAHDLRAPLRNMSMIAEMLSEGFVDHGDGKVELIIMPDDLAQKSMVLISDVLDPHNQHSFTYTVVELVADRTAI